MGTYGQDWASYQSATPSTAGLGFVFVKATEGTGYINPLHAAQVAHARADGLVVGHYHYPHMAADPVVEAGYFLSAAKAQPGDVIALDWEGYDDANKGVSTSRQIAYKNAWLTRVQAAVPQLQVGTYANEDYLNRDPRGQYGDFLWIATGNKPAGSPGIDHTWLFHQYGAQGVDRDYCPLSLADLREWAHAKENDMTPDQAKQLQELHDLLFPFAGWGYKNADQAKKNPGMPDAYGYLTQTHTMVKAQSAAITALVAQLGKDVDTATVVAAVQQAIAEAVVHVAVDVTGPTA